MKRTKSKRRRQPNYLAKVKYLYACGALPPGSLHHLEVRHDNWCQHWTGGSCNCNPDIRVKYSVPGNTN
jgi:hypothetical protein